MLSSGTLPSGPPQKKTEPPAPRAAQIVAAPRLVTRRGPERDKREKPGPHGRQDML